MRVYPGIKLGTSDELMTSDYSYTDENNVYAEVVGEAELNGEVKLNPFKHVLNMRPGTIVYGRIENILGVIAIVSISPAEEEEDMRYCNLDIWAALHVSKLGFGYVDKISDVLMVGDIIRAEITKYELKTSVIDLTLVGKGLGVVLPRNGRKITNNPNRSRSNSRDSRGPPRDSRSHSRDSRSHSGDSSRSSSGDSSRSSSGDSSRDNSSIKYKKSYEVHRTKKIYGKPKNSKNATSRSKRGSSNSSRTKTPRETAADNIKKMLK